MSATEIRKTYKLFIGGQFPRTESGRYYKVSNAKNEVIANMCLASRKDFRNAVVAARKAFESWSTKSAFNRSQILYRMAEILEGRKAQFVDELMQTGMSKSMAEKEVRLSVDRMVYYSGWCDKYHQLFGTVNPVSSSHFNFSMPEAMGVIGVIAPESYPLLGLVSVVLPLIAGGNTVVVLASEKHPLCSISLAEVLATSDLSGGVVNILTGTSQELHTHFASHMDVNAILYARADAQEKKTMAELSAMNVKRSFFYERDWYRADAENPYDILDFQEIKTTWHPIEQIGTSGAKY